MARSWNVKVSDSPNGRWVAGAFACVSVGKVRPDWSRSAARKRDLSFWSGDVPLFVTRTGKLIPADANSPTARLNVFRAPAMLALDYGAYPSRTRKQHTVRDQDRARLEHHAHAFLSAFFRRTVTSDRDLCADLAAWILAIGSEGLRDDRQEVYLRRRWEKDYSSSGAWNPEALGRSIGGAIFLEIHQLTGVRCVPSKGRVEEWAGIQGIEMSDTPVHTALAWPRRRAKR